MKKLAYVALLVSLTASTAGMAQQVGISFPKDQVGPQLQTLMTDLGTSLNTLTSDIDAIAGEIDKPESYRLWRTGVLNQLNIWQGLIQKCGTLSPEADQTSGGCDKTDFLALKDGVDNAMDLFRSNAAPETLAGLRGELDEMRADLNTALQLKGQATAMLRMFNALDAVMNPDPTKNPTLKAAEDISIPTAAAGAKARSPRK